MKKLALAAASLVALVTTGPAAAAIVTDQSQTEARGAWSSIQSNYWNQSFTAGYDNSTGAGFYLYPYGATTGSVTIGLYATEQVSMGGIALASGTVTANVNSWADVTWDRVALVAGQTYWLTLQSASNLYVAYGATRYAGGTVKAFGADYSYNGTYDLAFRTYADNAPAAAAVPEPATWGLMLLGFGLVGAGMRSRRVRFARAAA